MWSRMFSSHLTVSDKIRAEIEAMQSSLRKPNGKAHANETSAAQKSGIGGPSALALERDKYKTKGALKGKGKSTDEDSLNSMLLAFRNRIRTAGGGSGLVEAASVNETSTKGYDGEILEEEDPNDEGWLGHSLKFRKDATLDIHKVDEYSVHDPLAPKKDDFTLSDAKAEEDRRRRLGKLPAASSSRPFREADGPRNLARQDRPRDSHKRG